jgi:hypothetical protein
MKAMFRMVCAAVLSASCICMVKANPIYSLNNFYKVGTVVGGVGGPDIVNPPTSVCGAGDGIESSGALLDGTNTAAVSGRACDVYSPGQFSVFASGTNSFGAGSEARYSGTFSGSDLSISIGKIGIGAFSNEVQADYQDRGAAGIILTLTVDGEALIDFYAFTNIGVYGLPPVYVENTGTRFSITPTVTASSPDFATLRVAPMTFFVNDLALGDHQIDLRYFAFADSNYQVVPACYQPDGNGGRSPATCSASAFGGEIVLSTQTNSVPVPHALFLLLIGAGALLRRRRIALPG